MKIERAVREQTYTLTSIAGPSGSGKTYSALLYARGLVGPEGKVGFIDTENKRSRFYADVAGGFDVIDLDPPFTAKRYIEAIKALEDAGYKAIVIDSISHEWEGTGGVLEQAEAVEQATKRAGLHCWQKPKAAHKKLMNELLQTKAHLIFCCRVKEKVVQVKGANGKTEIVNEGFVVVQEKSFIYEMTVSMMLAEGSHVPTIQKCPGDLMQAFPDARPITVDAGGAVKAWSEQGREIDEELETSKREGLEAANQGTMALMEWWKGLGNRQAKLEGLKDTFKSIAAAADDIRKSIHEAGGGDPGERLSQARAQSPAGEQEGFDHSKVAGLAKSLSTAPNSDDSTLSSQAVSDDAGDPPSSPAELDGDGESSSPSSPSEEEPAMKPVAEEDRERLIECARKMMGITQDDLTPNERFDNVNAVKAGWVDAMPEARDTIGVIAVTAQAVIAGKRTRPQAISFIEEMLGAEGKIGGGNG